MDKGYAIKPGIEEHLNELGLDTKIKTAVKTEGFSWGAFCHMDTECFGMLDHLKENGYQNVLPLRFIDRLKEIIEAKGDWAIKNGSKTKGEEFDKNHFPVLSGYFASLVLKPEELKDYKKFGCSSVPDLIGTVGAVMANSGKHSYREGYVWESEENGKKFVSEVSGSEHGDLRVYRTDHTYYETKDPLKNPVSYKPIFISDQQWISPYHSTETILLTAVLTYIDQLKIPSEILKDNADKFLKEVKTWNCRLGNFADAGDGYDFESRRYFLAFDSPFAVLGAENRWAPYQLFIGPESAYQIMVDPTDKSLVFDYSNGKKRNNLLGYDANPKPPSVKLRIPAAEVDHLIRGIFVQATRGLGRTSAGQLINLVNYRFSEQFEKDMAESRKRMEELESKKS